VTHEPPADGERTGVVVVRAWKRFGSKPLRARITGRRDVLHDDETSVTVAGAERASQVVRDWLVAFEEDEEPGADAGDAPVTKA
jgi:hypothetical protein